MAFSYPPLPIGVDAIRLLKLDPGDFLSPLKGTLTPAAFGDRPKYVALSYTWGSSYPDNSTIPLPSHSESTSPAHIQISNHTYERSQDNTSSEEAPQPAKVRTFTKNSLTPGLITLNNGHSLPIGHNLTLALHHLRSPTQALTLWIDALCINQSDTTERNSQVSLMAFTYTRATHVIAWLGTKDYATAPGKERSVLRTMSVQWKTAGTRGMGGHITSEENIGSGDIGEKGRGKTSLSQEPDRGTLIRMLNSAYWKRMWIMQEVCLPRSLLFTYGADVWTHDQARKWGPLSLTSRPTAANVIHAASNREEGSEAARKMLETRDLRHTEVMRLESLIERFTHSHCSEIRDRIYGLLGCANDVQAFASGKDSDLNSNDHDSIYSLKQHIDLLSSGKKSDFRPRRGIGGTLPVDYSCSFYGMWKSVLGFIYFQTREWGRNVSVLQEEANSKGVDVQSGDNCDGGTKELGIKLNERQISIIRTAGIVQKALGQKVEEELRIFDQKEHRYLEKTPNPHQYHPIFRATGYTTSLVLHLGPKYSALLGSSSSSHAWKNSWVAHYPQEPSLSILRRIDEYYTARLINLAPEDLARIRELKNPHVWAWRYQLGGISERRGDDEQTLPNDKNVMGEEDEEVQEPRIFLGTDHTIGLVPPSALPGDVIVKFWRCDAAIVVRPTSNTGRTHTSSSEYNTTTDTMTFKIVGRADVAEEEEENDDDGSTSAKSSFFASASSRVHDRSGQQEESLGLINVELDFSTLQEITAGIVAHPVSSEIG